MICYDEPLYRPPSEANSLIVQATLGCSHNLCTFCEMYKSKTYTERPIEKIEAEIAEMSENVSIRRVFIADGDAMALPADVLLRILEKLKSCFPKLQRVSIYANPGNLLKKTPEELKQLSDAGMTLLYLGIESGSDIILKKINKGALYVHHLEAITKAMDNGIDVSATIITGLGGKSLWREHIEQSAKLVSEAVPTFLSTLSLMLSPATSDTFTGAFEEGFEPQTDSGMLEEEKLLIELIRPPRNIIFRSNHASNALALRGTLPGDRKKLMDKIDAALRGEISTRPDWMRGL
ncbi:MAG: radical SAM protein [Spirochaetales bacterium]|uniref:Radical SAM protein n=1 Tax=Candidatus Thalassospirochaeta sargassi TaxID=3119039 RepID=A0AAJ1II71_9SPIO|nr:radical SAM protein [Spirochaetales bacterium]